MKSPLSLAAAFAALALFNVSSADEVALPNVTYKPSQTFNLWPGAAPGETGKMGPEHILPDRPRPFDQITDVSVPTLAVFLPPAAKRNSTAVLVIPGGGLDRLAIETEGFEVAQWLNEHGITAFLLKYRVPRRSGEAWKVGLQDAQRAMSLIRSRAAEWNIDSDALGTIGFSAGGEINVMLAVYTGENDRQYPAVDAADKFSTRPSFNIVMYGGGFADTRNNTMRADVASRLTKDAPPMFIAHAFDDQALSSVILMGALKRVNVPSELHIYSAGAHGFGVRDSGMTINEWREDCLNWLRYQGLLDPAGVRTFAKNFVEARDSGAAAFPRLTSLVKGADLAQAYAAQKRVVQQALAKGDAIAGYKGAFTTKSSQKNVGVAHAEHGVLFKAGKLDAAAKPTVALDAKRPLYVETEIGYVIATDIGTKLTAPRQAMTTVEALVPVIELPMNVTPLMGGKIVGADAIAANVGSNRFIVGASVAPNKTENLDKLAIALTRDGKELHKVTGADVDGGQAKNLMLLINEIVEQGHVLHRGDIIICGALGGPKPGEKGSYVANYGALGTIEFKLE
jgi:2-keto-4-pentenoate hydratase/acetyl esterase/lipase